MNHLNVKNHYSMLYDNSLDESGYSSFQGVHSLHNTPEEASFILEANIENCKNVSNKVNSRKTLKNLPTSLTEAKKTLKNELKNPNWSSIKKETNNDLSNYSDDICTSPLPQHFHSIAKRRKQHLKQSISPKKSRKRLNFVVQTEPRPLQRTRFYNGEECLDIIGLLDSSPALDLIIGQLNTRTLDAMTQVSRRWQQIVYCNKRATERLHMYHKKLKLTKENLHIIPEKTRRMRLSTTVPLQKSNSLTNTVQYQVFSTSTELSEVANTKLIEQRRRVKCPQCGKCSKVFYSNSEMCHSNYLSDPVEWKTVPSTSSISTSKWITSGFSSCDGQSFNDPSQPQIAFAECMAVTCKFKFCLHCSCRYHPGEKCSVTELGTPSKLLTATDNTTPPKCFPKHDTKLSRKKSLKRLCF